MSLTRAFYAIGFLGLVLVLLLQFAALAESSGAQDANTAASGLQHDPDRAITLGRAGGDYGEDVFFKLAPSSSSRSGRVESVSPRHGTVPAKPRP